MLLTIISCLLLLSDWSIDACALVLSFYTLLKLKGVMIKVHQLAIQVIHTLSATALHHYIG